MSIYLTLRPLAICCYEAFVFDKLSKRIGTERLLRWLVCLPPALFLLYLAMSTATLAGTLSSAYIVLGLALSLLMQVVFNSMFLCGDVLIPARSPTADQLSTVNALLEVVGQVAVGTGASVGSSLFADSAASESPVWRGKMVWIALFGFSCLSALIAQKITHIDGWREKTSSDEEVDNRS